MAIIFGSFLGLLLLGVPIFYALGGSALAYFMINDIPAWTVVQRQFVGLNSFVQVAIPMFVLAGNLMDAGGSLDSIVRFAKVTVGRFKGGMAHVNIMASMMFAGVTGSAVADVAALGPLKIQMMGEQGYDREYAAALSCSAASVGPIIPPSLPLVMFGVVSGASVGELLIAGLIPGILMSLALMVQVVYVAHRRNYPTADAYPLRVVLKEAVPAMSAMSVVIIVLGGIYTGFCTPTEAAGIACLWSFILGKFVYRKLKWRDIPGVLIRTARILGSCSAIFAVAACFSYVITFENVPRILAGLLLEITDSQIVMLMLVNLLLLFIGCFMEGLSAIMIITPMLLPVLIQLGCQPVHIGVILAINTTLGLLTPPLGLSLFMASSVTGIPVLTIAKKAMPMFAVLVAVLLLITYVPWFSMILPDLMMGR